MTAADALRRLQDEASRLGAVARDVRDCSAAWEPGARLIGNVTAADLAALAAVVPLIERLALDGLAGEVPVSRERCPIDWCSSLNFAAAGLGVQTFIGPSPAPLRSMSIYCSEACRDAATGKRRQP